MQKSVKRYLLRALIANVLETIGLGNSLNSSRLLLGEMSFPGPQITIVRRRDSQEPLQSIKVSPGPQQCGQEGLTARGLSTHRFGYL